MALFIGASIKATWITSFATSCRTDPTFRFQPKISELDLALFRKIRPREDLITKDARHYAVRGCRESVAVVFVLHHRCGWVHGGVHFTCLRLWLVVARVAELDGSAARLAYRRIRAIQWSLWGSGAPQSKKLLCSIELPASGA